MILAAYLLGLRQPELIFDLTLRLATLTVVVVFFWSSFRGMAVAGVGALHDWRQGSSWSEILAKRPAARLLWLVALGSIPMALMGLLFRQPFEAPFGDIRALGWQLLVTAGLLLATLLAGRGQRTLGDMRAWDAIIIGMAQGVAFMPAISRTAAVIAIGLLLRLDRELAARYAFVLSAPAMAGALVLAAAHGPVQLVTLGPLVSGFATAFLCGLAALAFLMPVVRQGRMYRFAAYVIPLALGVLWFSK